MTNEKAKWLMDYEEQYLRTTGNPGSLEKTVPPTPGKWILVVPNPEDPEDPTITGPYEKSDITYMTAVLSTRPSFKGKP